MYIVCVTIFVKPENVNEFIAATLDNAHYTRREPNNLRFDVLQDESDPNRFFLYEAYKTRDDFASHQQTPHYLSWKSTVADFMAQPRQATKNHPRFFDNDVA